MSHLQEWTYILYLAISITLTVWVARTLHRNGRVFLVDCAHGNEAFADSLNHLLVVGFYLINVGYICAALQFGTAPRTFAELLEVLSAKIGIVLLVLGFMHFLNLAIFTRMRRNARRMPSPPLPSYDPCPQGE
jgi:hypothetical protein